MNIKSLFNILNAVREYLFASQKLSKKFQKISDIASLEIFISERSAYVTQTTLYGYLKTRMGLKYTIMFSEDIFIQSVNKSKWNIFVIAASDLTLYSISRLISKNLIRENKYDLVNIYQNVMSDQLSKGLSKELYDSALNNFRERIKIINIFRYCELTPFVSSGQALYNWAPIADHLKVLDKEIVLNSVKNKWNTVINDFEKLISKFET
ncbi:MAG: esterase [Candidatus Pelagibacter sp.]|nr:esterase [Candidatus Pelagibacter sp.]OUW23565.1 MAG: hypothetical protein CBD34_02740 [Rickettsiales bacterium TMED174]OUW24359.1 MAG: hypothetical protein CBD34_01190 [Rickettsiales bacterium TMED174]